MSAAVHSTRGKPRSRRIKKQVGSILKIEDRKAALGSLAGIEPTSLTGPLFSYFYSLDDTTRFRSVVAMADLTARIADQSLEQARIILRRMMWNLNDESGGIGWGSCEAMGEILRDSDILARDFGSILLSYIDPCGNFLEHEMLQRGVLWGVGTILETQDIGVESAMTNLAPFLGSSDPIKRGYAVRAMSFCRNRSDRLKPYRFPDQIQHDQTMIPLFDGWFMVKVSIAALALPDHDRTESGMFIES